MIAVTGTGVVAPLGQGTESFVAALRAGQGAIRELGDDSGVAVGARFSRFPDLSIEPRLASLLDPVSQYALAASREALESAGLAADERAGIGCVMGIGICGIQTIDTAYHDLYAKHLKVHPFAIPKIMPSAPASAVTMGLGIKGPSFCTTSACASSAHAIITGALMLDSGLVDAVVVGGAEAPFAYGLLQAWRAMRVLADDTCRPFSVGRRGMVLGEGAGALVLERMEHARARNAPVLAVLRGFGANADAGHIVKPDLASVVTCMRQALGRAGLGPADIGHINGHATGTLLNDEAESHAIDEVFAGCTPAVSGTKGATGHTLGAAGAIEAVIVVESLAGGWLPPTLNHLGPDPACARINLTPAIGRDEEHQAAMSNSFGFGDSTPH
jgi:nodulation protein E